MLCVLDIMGLGVSKSRSYTGSEGLWAMDVSRFAVRYSLREVRGGIPVSAKRLMVGLVRKAPVVRRMLVDWMVFRRLRFVGEARP